MSRALLPTMTTSLTFLPSAITHMGSLSQFLNT